MAQGSSKRRVVKAPANTLVGASPVVTPEVGSGAGPRKVSLAQFIAENTANNKSEFFDEDINE